MNKSNKLKSVLKWIKSYFSIQKSKEAYCTRHGHAWINNFDPENVDGKKLKQRIYCTRCHQKYHEHEYCVHQIGKNISK